MATIKDIAREANVSVGTVSNVLNRPSYVTAEVRARVEGAMTKLNYLPSTPARQYRPGRQRVLALSIADLANPYFADICVGAEKEANRRGVGIIIANE
jgi:LacI family transcriptional regulator